MSIIVTRSIQILCMLFVAGALLAIVTSIGHPGDDQAIATAGVVIGFAVGIFLLATILRVVSDVSEKILLSIGYRKETGAKVSE